MLYTSSEPLICRLLIGWIYRLSVENPIYRYIDLSSNIFLSSSKCLNLFYIWEYFWTESSLLLIFHIIKSAFYCIYYGLCWRFFLSFITVLSSITLFPFLFYLFLFNGGHVLSHCCWGFLCLLELPGHVCDSMLRARAGCGLTRWWWGARPHISKWQGKQGGGD